ncbi:MAG TPA: hypothetical protein VMH26_16970 [Burkholderiales bacterium]|nr:hypothetical protein [Burkholderiales bacterium]
MLERAAALGAAVLVSAGSVAAAGTTWDKNADWLRGQIDACARRTGGFVCSYFPARALNQLFGIGDFCDAEHCLRAHEIADQIAKDGQWTALGKASDQAILNQAQEMATGGLPVIAVQTAADKGMIAIVMPGKPVTSQSWGRKVPLAVGARLDRPEASVYSQGLSYLFSDPSKVMLYVQK